jgi:hypothetical protein
MGVVAVTGPADDWDAEYGEGAPNQAWFEKYLAEVNQAADESVLIDAIAAGMAAAERRIVGDTKDWQPLGILSALNASTLVAPNRAETEEQRVARELVPLVRAAAAEVPLPPRVDVLGGHLREFRTVDAALDQHEGEQQWGEFLDRWDLTPNLTPRQHNSSLPCWCDGFMLGDAAVHLDARVPPGGCGHAFSADAWGQFR